MFIILFIKMHHLDIIYFQLNESFLLAPNLLPNYFIKSNILCRLAINHIHKLLLHEDPNLLYLKQVYKFHLYKFKSHYKHPLLQQMVLLFKVSFYILNKYFY